MEWKRHSSFIFIKARPGTAESVYGRLIEKENVIGAFMLHWPWDILVWLGSENIEETHAWIMEMRRWEGVENTSTHQVFQGYKRDYWFWERPVCAWIKVRSRTMYETYDDLKNYDWVCTFASVPGDWDCIGLVCGNNWDEVLARIGELKEKEYELELFTTYSAWWNKAWEGHWFPPMDT